MEQPDFSIEIERPEVEESEQSVSHSANVHQTNQIPEETPKNTTSYLAETIEIAQPQRIFPHIQPYPEDSPKQHHFRLIHRSDQARLIQLWSQYGIKAELNESGKNNVDLTLIKENRSVGKIQFLHFDRRDRAVRAKHYVKLYLYQFEDSNSFDRAKQIMIEYFDQIGHAHKSPRKLSNKSSRKTKRSIKRFHKRSHRTMKKPFGKN